MELVFICHKTGRSFSNQRSYTNHIRSVYKGESLESVFLQEKTEIMLMAIIAYGVVILIIVIHTIAKLKILLYLIESQLIKECWVFLGMII